MTLETDGTWDTFGSCRMATREQGTSAPSARSQSVGSQWRRSGGKFVGGCAAILLRREPVVPGIPPSVPLSFNFRQLLPLRKAPVPVPLARLLMARMPPASA